MKSTLFFLALAFTGVGALSLSAQSSPPKKAAEPAQKAFLDIHLTKARASYDQGKMDEASLHIFKAVDSIHKHMITAESTPTKDLVHAANTLEELAKRVEAGRVNNSKSMEQDFSKATIALAKYYSTVAENAHKAKQPAKAGLALQRAAFHLEHSAKWSGQKLGDAGRETIKDFRTLGSTLAKSGNAASKLPATLLKNGRNLIEQIESNRPPQKKGKPGR
ncbi:hypothetical protein N9230_04090 [Akkermansiaceae bacterium]|nr:hypothetical protein [Akkermansiaceae bacterium]